MTLDEILAAGREIWGDQHHDLEEISVRLGVVLGDICRQARGLPGLHDVDYGEVKAELGNLICSAVRFCDDLRIYPEDAVRAALERQREYVAQGKPR